MSFSMSNKAFLEAFGDGSRVLGHDKEGDRSFYENIKGYLSGKDSPSAERIRKWIEGGNLLCAFTCRADVVMPLLAMFRDLKLPYILVQEPMGDMGFLIRESDTKAVRAAIRDVLKTLSLQGTIAQGDTAQMYYLRSNHRDKMMVQVGGLQREEASYLARAAAAAMPGECVGLDEMSDGTYLVTCHGKTAMAGRGGAVLGGALTETMMLFSGESSREIRKEEKEREAYLSRKAKGFPADTGETWVVGRGNRYVRIDEDGFTLGHAAEGGIEGVVLEEDFFVETEDSAYTERMESALSKVIGHTCLYSRDEAIAWFKGSRDFFPPSSIVGQQTLASRADAAVLKKISGDSLTHMEGRWDKKLLHYREETALLLASLAKGKVPRGYRMEDAKSIARTIRSFSLDPQSLSRSAKRMQDVGIYGREAGPQKVQDVQKQIDRASGIPERVPGRRPMEKDRGRGGDLR